MFVNIHKSMEFLGRFDGKVHITKQTPKEFLPQGFSCKSATTYFHAPFPANYLGHE